MATSRLTSLLDQPKDGSRVEFPVFKLPTELMMLIFRQYHLIVGPPITLTHTCRRWRQIAINDASLWTNICIQTTRRPRIGHLGHFLSFLGMQLDRTAKLPLDVTWIAEIGDEIFTATLQLLREKAPFIRWRTLRVAVHDGGEVAPWSSGDAFTNLEALHVLSWNVHTLLGVIDRTITSRLKELDLLLCQVDPTAAFARSLTHISSLVLSNTVALPSLPENVVNLQLDWGRQHIFPHLQTYKLAVCKFDGRDTVDLRSMTNLTVTRRLLVIDRVFLPALQKLTIGILQIATDAKIEAPALDILSFTDNNGKNVHVVSTEWSLTNPECLLSPHISIIADSYMPTTHLITILVMSPKVTRATLRFTNWAGAQAVLENLVSFGTESDSFSVENKNLCPRLSELTLDFGWRLSEPSASKEWLLERLKARREAGITPLLSIYARWKGEGMYVLVTGN